MIECGCNKHCRYKLVCIKKAAKSNTRDEHSCNVKKNNVFQDFTGSLKFTPSIVDYVKITKNA